MYNAKTKIEESFLSYYISKWLVCLNKKGD